MVHGKRLRFVWSTLAILTVAMTLAACGDDPQVADPPTDSQTDDTDVPVTGDDGPDALMPEEDGSFIFGAFENALLVGDVLIHPPDSGYEDSGQLIDVKRGINAPLFDFSQIPGKANLISGISPGYDTSPSATDGTTFVVSYVTQLPDEGIERGAVEFGLLIRAIDGDRLGEQRKVVLESFNDREASEVLNLVNVSIVGRDVVVTDFATSDQWRVTESGSVKESKIGSSLSCDDPDRDVDAVVCVKDTTSYPTKGYRRLDMGDRDQLLLFAPDEVSSGYAFVMRIDLRTGEVTGPVSLNVPSGVSGMFDNISSGGFFCSGPDRCTFDATASRSEDDATVLYTFDPMTLERRLTPIEGVADGVAIRPFGDDLLFRGQGGGAALMDADATTVKWEISANNKVYGKFGEDPFLFAQNSQGETFSIDVTSGEVINKVDFPQATGDLLGFMDGYVVYQSDSAVQILPLPE